MDEMDFSQPQAVNTDNFSFANPTGMPSESVQMADFAMNLPVTTLTTPKLSEALIQLSANYTPVPFSLGRGGGSPNDVSSSIGDMVDNREQGRVWDIHQDEIYTRLGTEAWEDWSGFGKISRYESYIKGTDNEDRLAKQQSEWQKWGRGLEKGLVTASSMVAGTVGMIAYGIPQAIQQKSLAALVDNDVSRFLDDMQTVYQHEDMIYKSQEYKNKSVLGQLGTTTWWSDTALQGFGYLLGGLAVGGATGALLKSVGLGGGLLGASSQASLRGVIGSALVGDTTALGRKALISTFKQAIKKDLMNTTLKSSLANAITLLTSAAPESQIEALSFVKEQEENFVQQFTMNNDRPPTAQELSDFKTQLDSVGNGVFAANLALVGSSNLLQFGDLMGADKIFKKGIIDNLVNKTFGLGLKQTISDVSTKGLQSATWEVVKRNMAQKVGYRVFKALESPVTEGLWEEGMQSVVQNTASEYLESRYDPNAMEKNKSIIKSLGEGFSHTYGSKEGWQEIVAGMVIGAGGSIRTKGGFDILGQREASREINKYTTYAQDLNTSQENFIEANERLLEAQKIYNNLDSESVKRLQDRIGGANQQISNSDKAREASARGDLQQAQLYYTNAVFAKLLSEKRAGLSDSNKFDIDMMIESVPDETLKDIYGFKTEEEIQAFKSSMATNLENQREAFDVAYDFAESLNIGATNVFSSENLKEASALQFFHGMMAADTANTLAREIENNIGVNGIADALNYYSNLDNVNQQKIQQLNENEEKRKDLEREQSKLLESFSKLTETSVRQPENESIVNQLNAVSAQLEGVSNSITELENETSALTEILNNRASRPTLPFGNPAAKFFANINLDLANQNVSDVMDSLKELDRYISHLEDSTGKEESQGIADKNKAAVLKSLMGMYQSQMKLMRNFAKTANMVTDPSYGNNIRKRFSRKKETMFDNDDWRKNDSVNFDVSKEELFNATYAKLSDEIKQKVDAGKISLFDLHTWESNVEILTMNGYILKDDNISLEQMNSVFYKDEDGNLVYDRDSELGQELIDSVVDSKLNGEPLSITQIKVYEANKEEIDTLVEQEISSRPATVDSLIDPEGNEKVDERVRLEKLRDKKIEEARRKHNEELDRIFNDGSFDISKIRDGEQILFPERPNTANLNQPDIESMTQLEYAEYLRQNGKVSGAPTTYDELTTHNKYRGLTTAERLSIYLGLQSYGDAFAKISDSVHDFFMNNNIPGVKAINGTWNHFIINTDSHKKGTDRYKAYGTFTDFTNITEQQLKDFVTFIQSRGYNGQLKFPALGSRVILGFDNIVMHGATEADAKLGEELIREFFKDNVSQTMMGKDTNGTSYSDNLAKGVDDFIKNNPPTQPSEILDNEPSINDIADFFENKLNEEIERINQSFEEALNPTKPETQELMSAIDHLNGVIEDIVSEIERRNRVINRENVNNFSEDTLPIKEEFKRINQLLDIGVRTKEEQAELDSLLRKINDYGLIEGQISSVDDTPVRLSDLLQQRNQLENEVFNPVKNLQLIDDISMREITTELSSNSGEELPFSDGKSYGDASVLNSYEFSTFTKLNNDTFLVANITPEGITTEIIRDKAHNITVVGQDGTVRLVDTTQSGWDNQIEEGDRIIIDLHGTPTGNQTINLSVDRSRRVVIPIESIDTINNSTNLNFDSKNIIGKSNYYVLTRTVDGVETHMGSDFDIELDAGAAQRLNAGDEIYFEFDSESVYNQGLIDELESVTPDPNSAVYQVQSEVEELLSEIEANNLAKTDTENPDRNVAELNRRNKDLYGEISILLPGVHTTPASIRSRLKKDINNYEKAFDSNVKDEVRRNFKDNMVIVAKDKSGNRVGIVKSLHNTRVNGAGRTQMDFLRTSLFEELEGSNFNPKSRTKFSVPIQISYMGIPNTQVNDGTKQLYSFSEANGEFNIHPNRIKSVGYVTYNEMRFSDGKTIDTPYNYAKNILNDTTYQGRRVPVVVFEHEGKTVIYPITLTESGTESVSEQFDNLLNQKESVAFTDHVESLNNFLAENGINKSIRVTSLNYETAVVAAQNELSKVQNIPALSEFMDPLLSRDILKERAQIDINLNDKPFIGPKLRFDMSKIPSISSELLTESLPPNLNPKTMDEILEEEDNLSCLD